MNSDKKRSTETVRFSNRLNFLNLTNLTSAENDLFFIMICKIQNQGINLNVLTFEDFKQYFFDRSRHKFGYRQLEDRIVSMTEKFSKINCASLYENEENGKKFKVTEFMPLFSILRVKSALEGKKNFLLDVQLNPAFETILNRLSEEFTAFELKAFISLKSIYAKTLFRLLKQFRFQGVAIWKTSELKQLLGIPDSYHQNKLISKALEPAVKELSSTGLFINLKYSFWNDRYGFNRIEFNFEPELQPQKRMTDQDGNPQASGFKRRGRPPKAQKRKSENDTKRLTAQAADQERKLTAQQTASVRLW